MRSGMSVVVQRLRGMAQCGTADYSIGTVDYWSDDQLQAMLDRNRADRRGMMLWPALEYSDDGADVVYRDYAFHVQSGFDVEQAAEDALWAVRDSDGAIVSTDDYTVDYDGRVIRFAADTEGASYTLDARIFKMSAAAADVWMDKASHYAGMFDWKTDGHQVQNTDALREHALKMADHYRDMAGIGVAPLMRSDVNASP